MTNITVYGCLRSLTKGTTYNILVTEHGSIIWKFFNLLNFFLERNIEEWISFCSTKAMYKMTPLPIFSHLILLIHTGFHISLSEGNDSFAKILISRKIYSSEESNLLRFFFEWICKHEDLFFWFIKSLLSEKYYSSWRLLQAN